MFYGAASAAIVAVVFSFKSTMLFESESLNRFIEHLRIEILSAIFAPLTILGINVPGVRGIGFYLFTREARFVHANLFTFSPLFSAVAFYFALLRTAQSFLRNGEGQSQDNWIFQRQASATSAQKRCLLGIIAALMLIGVGFFC